MSGNGDSRSKFDIGVFLGGIRPQLWMGLYESLKKSCDRHTFQLVVAGPYSPPVEMLSFSNFKFIKDWGGPARGAQLAVSFVESYIATLGADDALYRPGVLSNAIDHYNSLKETKLSDTVVDIVLGLKYGEGGNMMGDSYWKAWTHPPLQLQGIPKSAPMVLNSIANTFKYQRSGYDLRNFSTCNWGGHDMYHRWLYKPPTLETQSYFEFHPEHVMECTWKLDAAGVNNDHQPIAEADDYRIPTSDYKTFHMMYQGKLEGKKNEISDWRHGERIWSKRFKVTNK